VTARIIVTGTDTDVGKTVFAAGLTQFLDGMYWKPVQAGLEGETDTEVVRRLSALSPDRTLPSPRRRT
jgi:dethiobiotin synthetase